VTGKWSFDRSLRGSGCRRPKSRLTVQRGVAGSERPVEAEGGMAGSNGPVRCKGGVAGSEGLVVVQGECGPVRGARGGTRGSRDRK